MDGSGSIRGLQDQLVAGRVGGSGWASVELLGRSNILRFPDAACSVHQALRRSIWEINLFSNWSALEKLNQVL
jgi:hypothetical protein